MPRSCPAPWVRALRSLVGSAPIVGRNPVTGWEFALACNAGDGRLLTDVPGAALLFSCIRLDPQHIVVFSLYRRIRLPRIVRVFRNSLQQTCCSGERKPCHCPLERPACDEQRRWSCNPQAQAIKAIHEPACDAVSQERTKSHDEIGRAVLVRQQVSYPPGRENGQYEVPHLSARRCRR
jgi:hypothetical protein